MKFYDELRRKWCGIPPVKPKAPRDWIHAVDDWFIFCAWMGWWHCMPDKYRATYERALEMNLFYRRKP